MYLIRSLNEPLYWSNDLGWVDRQSATQFSHVEHLRLRPPAGGIWEKAG